MRKIVLFIAMSLDGILRMQMAVSIGWEAKMPGKTIWYRIRSLSGTLIP